MIYKLQKKFIFISALSILAVILIIFSVTAILNFSSMSRNLDMLADGITAGGGRFPDRFGDREHREEPREEMPKFEYITPETPFSTRYFTVWFNQSGEIDRTDTEFIHSIDETTAIEYAKKTAYGTGERGWIGGYRYKVFTTEKGKAAVFIDARMNLASFAQNMLISACVLIASAILIMVLILIMSRRAVKPVAESYEKQKQFVTDVNHELKTPLTLILANLDIAESELGKNEWLEDIRSESRDMTKLVGQLVDLSRMDEDSRELGFEVISFTSVLRDVVSDFCPIAEKRGLSLSLDAGENIKYNADEAMMRRLISILLDNAIKYCDEGGEISVCLRKKRHIVLTVSNTYSDADKITYSRLFDRFYRDDNARNRANGNGIGLSLARSIVQKHKGDICAFKKDKTTVEFKVTLK